MSLDDLIQENYDRMNANDHRVWQYICRHREECRKMPLHQLADACEVSPATVLRFLKLINMDGYSDFKAFLKWDSLNKPVFNQHSIEQNSFNLTRTIASIQQADCTELFERMDQSERLYAYGSGSIQKSAAKALKNYLIFAERILHVIEGAEERIMAMNQMQKGDVAFLISVSGNNPVMNDYANALRVKGVYLAAICQDGANDLSKICHFCLPFFTQRIDVAYPGVVFYSSAGLRPPVETLVLKYIDHKYRKHADRPVSGP